MKSAHVGAGRGDRLPQQLEAKRALPVVRVAPCRSALSAIHPVETFVSMDSGLRRGGRSQSSASPRASLPAMRKMHGR